MHDTMKKIEVLSEIKEKLAEWSKSEIEQGRDYAEQPQVIEGLGQWIDMIKDLAEAEANCMKKKYYEMMICNLMEEDESMNEVGRMGYDNWRYASGQYAPKGHGHRSGYSMMPPYFHMNPEPDMMEDFDKYIPQWKMGYSSGGNSSSGSSGRGGSSSGGRGGSSSGSSGGRSGGSSSQGGSSSSGGSYGYRMGYPMDSMMDNWGDYKDSRKYYTETGNEQDKHKMNEKIEECCLDSLDAMREMWQDANPETRKKLEMNISKFLEEMKKSK